MKILFFILVAVFLCQCSTLSKEQCEKGEWEKVGFIDGSKGRPADYMEFHNRACSMSANEKQVYGKARLLGLIQFCNYSSGYKFGVQGRSYSNICENLNEKEFKEAFLKGHKVFLLQKRQSQISSQIKEEKEKIEKDESVLNHATQFFNAVSGRSPTENLEREEQKLSREIYEIQSSIPIETSTNRSSIHERDLMIQSLGAFAGTFIGFGVGHAIQGRYAKDGWQWTLLESASIASIAMASSNSSCVTATTGSSASSCTDTLSTVAAFGFLGIRIWQAIKLWGHVGRSEYDGDYQVSISPNGLYLIGQF